MAGLRIKGPRPGYRRAGRVFGPDWTEVGPDEVSDAQVLQLLGDPALVLQTPDGKGEWSTVSAEDRAQAIEMHRGEPEGLTGDGSGSPLTDLDPQVAVAAQLGRDLMATIELHREMLETRGMWPVTVPQALFLRFADMVVSRDAVCDRLAGELADANALAKALGEEIDQLKTLKTATANDTPRDDEPDGGGGDTAAAPEGGDESQAAAPETVGEAAQGDGTEAPPPTPARKGRKAAK